MLASLVAATLAGRTNLGNAHSSEPSMLPNPILPSLATSKLPDQIWGHIWGYSILCFELNGFGQVAKLDHKLGFNDLTCLATVLCQNGKG